MQLIVAQNEDIIGQRIKNLIHNVGLFSEVKHLQQQLCSTVKALAAFQSDSTNIADAYEHWFNLTRCPELEPYHDKLPSCDTKPLLSQSTLSLLQDKKR